MNPIIIFFIIVIIAIIILSINDKRPRSLAEKQARELLDRIKSDPQPSFVSRSTVIKEDRRGEVDKYYPQLENMQSLK